MDARYDRIGGIVWVGIGLVITAWSATFPFGRWAAPGPAFLPLACGAALVILGAALALRAPRGAVGEAGEPRVPHRAALGRIVATLAALAVAAVLVDRLGFTATVLVLMLFLLRAVGGVRWPLALAYAVGSAVGCFVVFQYLLGVELPVGWLGF